MKKLIVIGLIVAICTACGGGSSVDKAISQVEKALENVEKNKGKMTEDDWKNLEKEVEAPLKVISEALDNDKVGIVGKMKILAVSAKWATALTEAGVRELERRTGIERENLAGEIEKASKELSSELEKVAKELEDSGTVSELEKALQGLGGEFEKAAQELMKNVEKASE